MKHPNAGPRALLLAAALCALAPTPGRAQDGGSEADPLWPGEPAAEAAPTEPSAALPEDGEPAPDGEYHTPLAGKRLETEVFGEQVVVEERDRGNTLAISLGLAAFTPNVGGNSALPMFAFYAKQTWGDDDRRLRAVLSVFVNDIDFEERFDGPKLLGRWDNYTIPFETNEIIDGDTEDEFALTWGTFRGALGAGYGWSISPGNLDNELHVGLLYHGGYEYHERGEDTPDSARVATDTYTHGLLAEVRLDAFQRNLLELPHIGWAAGCTFEFTRRDHWQDHGQPNVRIFERSKTRDYFKVSGYLALTLPLPLLSERHRVSAVGHAGYAPHDTLDRFSAFRLGGGPIPTEAGDLSRSPLPGAVFNQFPVEDYVVATLEYRFEVFFFLYLHLRGTYALAKAPTRRDGRLRIRRGEDYVFSAAITSGFLWNSSLYLEYSLDTRGVFRDVDANQSGHSFMLLWSKAF